MADQGHQELVRGHLLPYTMAMNSKYSVAPHHRLIADTIMDAFEGRRNRIMIFAPPRHGKSELVSKMAPSYFLGRWPEKKVIAASHTAALAEGFGGHVRDLLLDPLHLATFGRHAGLNPKTTAKGDFKTIAGGEYFAVGVGGTPIGKGGDLIVIDDPFKSREEAESPTQRQKVKDWYTSSMYSRLEGDGIIVLMHQRWHEDDLAGWLLREHSDENWHVIDLAASCYDEQSDPLGRVKGEALWPEKYDEQRLWKIARAIGPRDWLSMYQQQPRSQEGDEFKRNYLRYYERTPQEVARGMTVYILVDAASSKKKGSDFTAMAVIGIGADGNKYLLDGVRDKLKLSERAAKLMELHRKWRPRTVGYEQYGQMADVEHIMTVMESENYRFPIQTLGGRMRKEERVRRLLPDLENGVWYFPPELWIKTVDGKVQDLINTIIESEMLPFPVGQNEDFIDSMSRIYDVELVKPRGGNSRGGVSKGGPRPW